MHAPIYKEFGMSTEPEVTGRARGGRARATSMTAEERSESARKAALAKKELQLLPKATHRGDLKIGDATIPCAVLEDGTRVLTQEGFLTALGRAGKAKGGHGASAVESGVDRLPSFLSANNLKPFISAELAESTTPVIFRTQEGVKAYGYPAVMLTRVCRVYLEANDAGVILKSQQHIVRAADILTRGFAEVGIIALVDEATGFQRDRAKDALAKILEAFVAKELQPWLKTFPAEYYEQLFRLYGLKYPPERKTARPQFFGKITNSVVYDRLAPELLPELKKAATKAEKKSKLHQWLTSEMGHPKLREHLASIVTLLKLAKTPQEFLELVDRIHPKFGDTYLMDFDGKY
jgi:hypothetical protein